MRKFIIKFFLLLTSIYIPLLFYSFYDYFIEYNVIKESFNPEYISELTSQFNLGYVTQYNPNMVKKFAKDTGIHPIGTLPFTKTLLCDEGYGLTKYTSDRFGLRNPDEKWENLDKKSNIFLIGDSFTDGACVDYDSTIHNLVDQTNDINTINLGTSNNSPYEYLAVINQMVDPLIKKLNTKKWVVVIFYSNDNVSYNNISEKLLRQSNSIISNSSGIYPTNKYVKELTNSIKANFPTTKKELINKINFPKNKEKMKLIKIFTISRSISRINKFVYRRFAHYFLMTPSKKVITKLSDICRGNCTPLVVYIPNSSNKDPSVFDECLKIRISKETCYFLSGNYKERIRLMSTKANIKFIDGSQVIDRNNDQFYAPEGAHLSKEGYRKMADLISNEINK